MVQGFLRRFKISLRCRTKRAQKVLEELHDTIQAWVQFNRRNTVIRPNSDCRKVCTPAVPIVGRFKPSEIGNMDQTPLAFEFLNGRTYDKRGSNTI